MPGDFLSFDEMHEHFEVAKLLSNFRNRPCAKHGKYYNRCLSEADSYKRLVMNHTGELQYLKWDVDNRNWSLEWWNGGRQKTNVAFTMLVGNSAAAMLTIGWCANVCPGSGLLTQGNGILEIFLMGAPEIQHHLTSATCS